MDLKKILEDKSKEEIINLIVDNNCMHKVIRDNEIVSIFNKNKGSKKSYQIAMDLSEKFNVCERHVFRIVQSATS